MLSNKITIGDYVKYNNWEKVEENQSMIPSNFYNLLISSVTHHSKESFDIIMNTPNILHHMNKKLRIASIFENYIIAPNEKNRYYVDRILPHLVMINDNSLLLTMKDINLFHQIFNRLIKNEMIFLKLIENACKLDNITVFKVIYNDLKVNNYEFFNDIWINKRILFPCLVCDAINILKFLDNENKDITKIQLPNTTISSLIISISYDNLYRNNRNNIYNNCFDYLISKGIQCNENLLWSTIIPCYLSEHYNPFKLYINLPYDEEYIYPEDMEDEFIPLNNILNDSFSLENLKNDINDFNPFLIEKIVRLIQYNISKSYPIVSLLQVLDVNIIEHCTKYMFELTHNIICASKKNRYVRSYIKRRSSKNKKMIKYILEILKYIKESDIINYNPLNQNIIDITKNKVIIKSIVKELIDMKYDVSIDFKTNIMEKLFTKKEMKEYKQQSIDNLKNKIK